MRESITQKKRLIVEEIRAFRNNLRSTSSARELKINSQLSNSIDVGSLGHGSPIKITDASPEFSLGSSKKGLKKRLILSSSREQLKSESISMHKLESKTISTDDFTHINSVINPRTVTDKSSGDYYPIEPVNPKKLSRNRGLVGSSYNSLMMKKDKELPQLVQSYFLSKHRKSIVESAFQAYINPAVYKSMRRQVKRSRKRSKEASIDNSKISINTKDDTTRFI